MSLELTGISKRFGSHTVLNDLSLVLAPGESLAVLGPSGCGKTTLLRLIAGFETPDSGEISMAGTIVSSTEKHWPPHQRQVGMVFQDLALWPHLTVFENIAYSLSGKSQSKADKRDRVHELTSLLGIARHQSHYPGILSLGEQQRVALARAIIAQPQYLLLDEPLNSLDRETAMALAQFIRELHKKQGCTMIYITHNLEEAEMIADRTVYFCECRLIESTTSHAKHDATHGDSKLWIEKTA